MTVGKFFLKEDDIAVNNVGSGHIAGTQSDPPMFPAAQKKYLKKAALDAKDISHGFEDAYRVDAIKHAPKQHMEHAKKLLDKINATLFHGISRHPEK